MPFLGGFFGRKIIEKHIGTQTCRPTQLQLQLAQPRMPRLFQHLQLFPRTTTTTTTLPPMLRNHLPRLPPRRWYRATRTTRSWRRITNSRHRRPMRRTRTTASLPTRGSRTPDPPGPGRQLPTRRSTPPAPPPTRRATTPTTRPRSISP